MITKQPFGDYVAVVPSDTEKFLVSFGLTGSKTNYSISAKNQRGIYTPDGGDIAFISSNGNQETITVDAGTFIEGMFQKILETGTTATVFAAIDGLGQLP